MTCLFIGGLFGCVQTFAPVAAQKDPSSSKTPDDSTPSPTPVPSAPEIANVAPVTPVPPAETPEAPAPEAAKVMDRTIAANPSTPMGPKSDDSYSNGRSSIYGYAATYGTEFSDFIPIDRDKASWTLERGASTLNLSIRCEYHIKGAPDLGWSPCATDMKVRIIFMPQGKTSAQCKSWDQFCYDSSIESSYDFPVVAAENDPPQANVAIKIPNLSAGTIDLFAYRESEVIPDFFGNAFLLGSLDLALPPELKVRRLQLPPAVIKEIYRSAP